MRSFSVFLYLHPIWNAQLIPSRASFSIRNARAPSGWLQSKTRLPQCLLCQPPASLHSAGSWLHRATWRSCRTRQIPPFHPQPCRLVARSRCCCRTRRSRETRPCKSFSGNGSQFQVSESLPPWISNPIIKRHPLIGLV